MHGANCSVTAHRDRGLRKSSWRCKNTPSVSHWHLCSIESIFLSYKCDPINLLLNISIVVSSSTDKVNDSSLSKKPRWPELTFSDHLPTSPHTYTQVAYKIYTSANGIFFYFLFLVFRLLWLFYSLFRDFPPFLSFGIHKIITEILRHTKNILFCQSGKSRHHFNSFTPMALVVLPVVILLFDQMLVPLTK